MKYPSRWEWKGFVADWKAGGEGFPSQETLRLTETEFGLWVHNRHYLHYRHNNE